MNFIDNIIKILIGLVPLFFFVLYVRFAIQECKDSFKDGEYLGGVFALLFIPFLGGGFLYFALFMFGVL